MTSSGVQKSRGSSYDGNQDGWGTSMLEQGPAHSHMHADTLVSLKLPFLLVRLRLGLLAQTVLVLRHLEEGNLLFA